jgi:hypothetical protein
MKRLCLSTFRSLGKRLGFCVFVCTLGFGALCECANASVTTFDFPGSISTGVSGINSQGTIVGAYQDVNNLGHGFVRAVDDSFTNTDPPRATHRG